MTRAEDIAGVRCVIADDDGLSLADAEGARSLIEDAMGEGARVICVPASRLGAPFFQLSTGIAGEMLQKVVNYGMSFAVLGDIEAYVAESAALRDFVVECDRGDTVIFARDRDALAARMERLAR